MAYLRLPDGSYFKFDDKLSDEQAQQLAEQKHPDAFHREAVPGGEAVTGGDDRCIRILWPAGRPCVLRQAQDEGES